MVSSLSSSFCKSCCFQRLSLFALKKGYPPICHAPNAIGVTLRFVLPNFRSCILASYLYTNECNVGLFLKFGNNSFY
ncbi:hypothetical protein MCHI_001335 [Candidatus Magnetoovum chiemensis]|nr:hypothetical protein MCHI_001335 [Candidatus Magnetoovum chiemensis]